MRQWNNEVYDVDFEDVMVITDHLGIPNHLYHIHAVDLVYSTCLFQSMAKIILELLQRINLVNVVVTYRDWRSWWLSDEAFRRSQTLLQRSMSVDGPLF